jgi:hypothetical protein
VALDLGHQPKIDEVVVAFVFAFAAIGLGQFYFLAFNLVDRADMDAVGADDFHMLLDGVHAIKSFCDVKQRRRRSSVQINPALLFFQPKAL